MSSVAINTLEHTPLGAVMKKFEEEVVPELTKNSPGSDTITVFQGNEVIWCKGFGWAKAEKKVSADAESVYRIASVTKSFVATALMLLVEQGVLALDDPVEQYLPEIRGLINYVEYPPITFRQIASHTSGLAREADLPGNASGPIEEWEEKTLACIPTTRFENRPGEKFLYSNIAFCYLGLALGRAAGKPFIDLVHELILDPLGMKQSGFVLTPAMRAHLAEGYLLREDGMVDAETPAKEHAGRGCKVPAGGLYTTPGDLTRFFAAHTGTSPVKLLSDKILAEMQKIQVVKDDYWREGLGYHIGLEPDGTHLIVRQGNIAGYAARTVFEPDTALGVLLFRNYNQRAGEELELVCLNLIRELLAAQKHA